GSFGSEYPATKTSGRPSPLTSATAAPVYQPCAFSARSLKVPSPLFQSTSTPCAVVTTRSVRPLPVRSAATQPSPWTGSPACDVVVTLRNDPCTFSNSAERGRPPCDAHCAVSALEYELTTK